MIFVNEELLLAAAPRFWGKFDSGDINSCWEWPEENRDRDGYGQFGIGKKNLRAHRVALELASGTSPEDKPFALHSCDNPPCVNPSHLRWDTAKSNSTERESRKRRHILKGESHPMSKLSVEDVIQIRRQYAAGSVTLRELGAEFGVTESSISQIINRKNWKHV